MTNDVEQNVFAPTEGTSESNNGDFSVVITDISQQAVAGNSLRLDVPGTRTDTVPVTKPGDGNTPLSPDNPKDNPSVTPETDADEALPFAPRITFGTASGLFARWGTSELANEYYLTPGDAVTLSTANEPEGAKVYFTAQNTAIEAYKADPAFDFTADNSGWTEYTDRVTIPFADHYARVAAVMTDESGKAIKGTFVSTNFWELDCERKIGMYGAAGTYNLRMTDYLNLSGATAKNITQTYYLKAAVNEEAAVPTAEDYDFKLSDSEPGYLNEILDKLSGDVSLNYKGICVYVKDGEAVYTSPVCEGSFQLNLAPSPVFSNEFDETDVLYYPCKLSAKSLYGGNYDAVYYSVGKIGDPKTLDGWTKADGAFEVGEELNADDVALYAILVDSKTGAGYPGNDGSFVIFELPLIRVAGTGSSGETASSEITLQSSGVPENYTSEIYYTLDGSDPVQNGTLYTGPISTADYSKGEVVTVRAFSKLSNGAESINGGVSQMNITVTASAPRITAANGTVTIASDGGAVYYTVDGSSPVDSATRKPYTGAFSLGGLNRRVRAVSYSDGSYSAETELIAEGGGYSLDTLSAPYSFTDTLDFYVSEVENGEGAVVEKTQTISFTLTEPGIISFDIYRETVQDGGYAGYDIYYPYLDDAAGTRLDILTNTESGGRIHYYSSSTVPAGAYTLTIRPDYMRIYHVRLKNFTATADDRVFFNGAVTDMGEKYISDRGYYLYPVSLNSDAVIYYNLTTDGSEPAAPTLQSPSVQNNRSVVYVGSEKPVVRIKAAVYHPETGTLGSVYSGFYGYAGIFDMYAVDENGTRTAYGWGSLNGSEDVIIDKTGRLYINKSDWDAFFPGEEISVEYYYSPSDSRVFNDDGTLRERSALYVPGEITLADIAQLSESPDYRRAWGVYLRAGARVTVGNEVYYFSSDNRGYVRSVPSLPVVTVDGNTITLSTESESAKLYYSLKYNVDYGTRVSDANSYYEYTAPVQFDRNLTFTAMAVWETCVGESAMFWGKSTNGMQLIESTEVEAFALPEVANNQSSAEYYLPVVADGMSQSVDITVPAGYKYFFDYLRTIRHNGVFDSECSVNVKLQKLENGAYVTVDNCWFNLPYPDGIWYDSGPFLTSGDWRLTFYADEASSAGQKAIVYFRAHCVTNEGDFSYPRLGGLKVTPKMDGMEIDVNDITIPDKTVDELFTYITVNKGKTIESITGSADGTEAEAKAVIKAYLEDNSNYDYVKVWRRARNANGYSGIDDIHADSGWIGFDLSDNLEADTEYIYIAEIYLKGQWAQWNYGVFDRHGNAGWFRTEFSSPLYVLPEDDEAPVINDFYFLLPGDVETDNISTACTIFANATDNQRVKSYLLDYKLSSESDEQYQRVDSSDSVRTKDYTFKKTLRYVALTPGSEYTFRYTVTDANGNKTVRTFTVLAEEIPAPQDYTVTQASSGVVIHWNPKPGYRFDYDFYDENGKWFADTGWYRYDNTSAENGNRLVYVDPLRYPTFTIRQRQEAYDDYDISLDYVYKENLTDGADVEAPVVRGISAYNNSQGGYGNRYTSVRAWDDGRLYSLNIAYFTRSGEEGSYVYTPAGGFPEPATYYYSKADVQFNSERTFCADYSLKYVVPGVYYVGVRATDTAGNTSDWRYEEFRVSENDVKRTPLDPLKVTAGTDRFYIEPLVPDL